MISKEILRNAGYREWKKDHFQKRLDDDLGIKYFINIRKIELPWDTLHTIWDPSIQIETSNGAVEIELVQWFNNDGETSEKSRTERKDRIGSNAAQSCYRSY